MHRDHDAVAPVGQAPAQVIMGIQIADHETAAVQVDEDAQFAVRRLARPIDPDGDIAPWAGNGAIFAVMDLLAVGIEKPNRHLIAGARLRHGYILIGRPVGRLDHIQDFLQIGIDRHNAYSQ